jgi:hypothetical protein
MEPITVTLWIFGSIPFIRGSFSDEHCESQYRLFRPVVNIVAKRRKGHFPEQIHIGLMSKVQQPVPPALGNPEKHTPGNAKPCESPGTAGGFHK